MKTKRPLSIAILEEVLIFLAIVGISTILWAVEGGHGEFWREVGKSTLLGYVIRFLAEAVSRRRGKPFFRLMPQERSE